MTTKAEFRDQLRLRVNDPTESRWTNEELDLYLQESVNRYSKLFPRFREQEFESTGDSDRYPVPDDLVDQRVQRMWTVDTPTKLTEVPTYQMRTRRSTRWFEVVNDELVFGFVPVSGTTVRVRYGGLHQLPDTGDSTVPSEDEDLIYVWAEHLAWRKIAGSDASLSRWKESGKRDDSPIIPHYMQLERQYNRMVQEKKSGGRFLLLYRQEPRYRIPGWSVNS